MDREERQLALTGSLLDGTPFEATDCVLVIVPPSPPPAPSVTASATNSSMVELTWEGSESMDFSHYAVYRGDDPSFLPESDDAVYATTTQPRFVDLAVESGEHMYYRVAVFDEPVTVATAEGSETIRVFSGYSEAGSNMQPTDVIGTGRGAHSPVLLGAWPNPFTTGTEIAYTLPAEQAIRLSVYDVNGRLVDRLVDANRAAGRHVVSWDASRLSAGTYFYRLEVGDVVMSGRALVVK